MTAGPPPGVGPRQFVERMELGLGEEADLASGAAEQLRRVTLELVELMATRVHRSWTPDEFERYLALSRSERSCQLSYAMARHRFDALRARLLSTSAPERIAQER